MSLKNAKKVETNRYELEIVIDGATFSKAVDDAIDTQTLIEGIAKYNINI